MIIELLNNSTEIRAKFKNKYLLTLDEYIKVHPGIEETYAKMGKVFDEDIFQKKFMWDKPNGEFAEISQAVALEILKSIGGDVLFISEDEDFDGSCDLKLDGQSYTGFLAKGNAKELADLIEYEWYESWKYAMQDQYFDCSIPEDLYIFDESMEWVLVFTHEGNGRTMQEQAKNRWCYMYGNIQGENK